MDLGRIPHKPGCYLFKNDGGSVIYVGKAKDLRKRVSSYFSKKDLDPKTKAMVERIDSFDYIVTSNEKEALILENNLIKKHLPRYNISLRDSKRYAYILLTKEEYPRLVLARKKAEEGRYFGPFTSAEKRDFVMDSARNVFRLRTCKRLPKKKCIRYDMGRCRGPCIKAVKKEEYDAIVQDAARFLSGGNGKLIEDLKKRMASASKKKEYELARIYRDQVTAVEALRERQVTETARKYDQDVINYVVIDSFVHLSVFKAYHGILAEKEEYGFEEKGGFLEEFLLQYYGENPVPKEVIIPEKISPALIDYLRDMRGSVVEVIVPRKGEKRGLLDLVKKNVEKEFLEDDLALRDLKDALNLEAVPNVIECFDISHLSGTDTVGSMVRFAGGKPDKSNYRRFRIRSVEGIDDPKAIAEVVGRRYSRLIEEKKGLPDLIVIDGGVTQLNAAHKELRELKLRIPVVGLAKREEEIFLPGLKEPLVLEKKSRALHLLQRIRDEAHRFAIKYQKLLRTKRTLGKK